MGSFNAFEKQADGSLKLLRLVGEYRGQDASGAAMYGPLVLTEGGAPPPPQTPLAPTILSTSNMPTRTSATINWSASPNPDARPAVSTYRIMRDGAQVGSVSGTTLTFSESGLPTATPEAVFVYTVVPVSSEGVGDSSAPLTLQWGGVVLTVPTAPTLFSRSNMTATSIDLAWSETTDTTVDKHGLYDGATLVRDNLPATATTYSWTAITPSGRTFTSLKVKRHNAAGWSNASNALATFTLHDTTVAHDVVMGVPNNDEKGDLAISSWQAARCYDFVDVQPTVTLWGCRVIGLTDGTLGSNTGQSATATRLRNFLEGFYYTSAGVAKNTGIEIHWAVGNEIDKDANYTSGDLPPAYVETVRLCYNVVRTTNADGTRRYPMASCWVDMTQHQIKIHASGPRFKAIAQYLDGMACSMYPPGRDCSNNRPDSPVFTPYNQYVDAVMAVMADWNATYPTCNQFATWETGIPVDHADWIAGANKDRNGAPTASTDITIRPRYMTGGIDHAGTNWTGLLQYMYNALDGMGVRMREQIYWNQCSNPDIPNQMKWDKQPATTPDTEHAWHNWQPGVRLARG